MSAVPRSALPPFHPLARVRGLLQRHPVAVLLLLTPGIPEYLSGSSDLTGVLRNPVVFLVFLLLNVAMYGPGALLIREAMVRWRGGWGTVAVLGVAYAVMEEGIADATFFNPHSPSVGVLGTYGHFLGTNWVWIPGVVMVHVVFSLSIPIFLFGLAFPGLRGRPLLSGRQIGFLLGVLALDTAIIAALGAGAGHWFDGWGVVGLCLVAISVGAGIARALPAGWPAAPSELPRLGPGQFFLIGLGLFPTVAALPPLLMALGAPAAATFGSVILLLVGFAFLVYVTVGRSHHQRQLLMFAAGAIVPLAVLGIVAGFPVPIVLGADALAVVFFRHLWGRCVVEDSVTRVGSASVPPGALAGAG